MINLKRALALFTTLFLFCFCSVSAVASNSVYANIYYWENADANGINSISIDDSVLDRTLSISSGFYFGVESDAVRITNTTYNFSWEGNGRYNLAGYNYDTSSRQCWAENLAGQIIDMEVYAGFPADPGGKLNFVGDVQYLLYPTGYSVNDGSTITQGAYTYGLFPQRMQLLVNGAPVGEVYDTVGQGKFNFNFQYALDEYVNRIGYRFYFDTAQEKSYNAPDATLSKHLLMGIFDNAVVSVIEPAGEYTPYFQEVITEVKAIPSTIYNFFFGEDGDEVGEGFKSEVDGIIGSGEEVREEFEALEKPDPTDTIPDINVIIPQEEFQAYTAVYADVLQSKIVLPLMVMALSVALMAYVVYGKKG